MIISKKTIKENSFPKEDFKKMKKGVSQMIEIEREIGRVKLTLRAHFMGEDLCILITGGDKPHLGTITAGERLEPIQTVNFQNHKEFFITEEIALMLRKAFSGNFAVCCGAHWDNITKEEIKFVHKLTLEIGTELIKQLKTTQKAV